MVGITWPVAPHQPQDQAQARTCQDLTPCSPRHSPARHLRSQSAPSTFHTSPQGVLPPTPSRLAEEGVWHPGFSHHYPWCPVGEAAPPVTLSGGGKRWKGKQVSFICFSACAVHHPVPTISHWSSAGVRDVTRLGQGPRASPAPADSDQVGDGESCRWWCAVPAPCRRSVLSASCPHLAPRPTEFRNLISEGGKKVTLKVWECRLAPFGPWHGQHIDMFLLNSF